MRLPSIAIAIISLVPAVAAEAAGPACGSFVLFGGEKGINVIDNPPEGKSPGDVRAGWRKLADETRCSGRLGAIRRDADRAWCDWRRHPCRAVLYPASRRLHRHADRLPAPRLDRHQPEGVDRRPRRHRRHRPLCRGERARSRSSPARRRDTCSSCAARKPSRHPDAGLALAMIRSSINEIINEISRLSDKPHVVKTWRHEVRQMIRSPVDINGQRVAGAAA